MVLESAASDCISLLRFLAQPVQILNNFQSEYMLRKVVKIEKKNAIHLSKTSKTFSYQRIRIVRTLFPCFHL